MQWLKFFGGWIGIVALAIWLEGIHKAGAVYAAGYGIFRCVAAWRLHAGAPPGGRWGYSVRGNFLGAAAWIASSIVLAFNREWPGAVTWPALGVTLVLMGMAGRHLRRDRQAVADPTQAGAA